MVISAIAKRYAKAFVEVVNKKGSLEKAADELKTLANLFEQSEDFKNLLKNPGFKNEERMGVLEAVCKKFSISSETENLLKILIETGRASDLAQISEAVSSELDAIQGKARATLKSAVPIPLATLKRLQQTLEEKLGKNLEITPVIDPEVIGGVRAQVGHLVIDGTIKRRLETLKKSLVSK